jgi:3-dehydrotetronate 4-kinase
VTPAFPETGRTVYLGHLFVGSTPLNESPLKDHPLNPMHDSNLVRVLQRQSKGSVGLIDLMTVAEGSEAVSRARAELTAQGYGTAIVDAVFERDLEALGDAAAESTFSVGASGLGLGLARALTRGRAGSAHAATLEAVGGSAAILAGSCSRATLEQIAAVENEIPVLRLSSEALIKGAGETDRALNWAKERIGSGPVVIASSEAPEQVAALQARYGRDKAGHAIEHALADIASGLVAQGVRRLVVAGGETSGAAVDRLGVSAFRLGPEIAPGVPLMRTVGRTGGELQMALKSGNFGGRDFFTRALAMTR